MIEVSELVQGIPLLGMPDPRIPAAALAAMNPAGLSRAAEQLAGLARGLASCSHSGRPAIAELARGWSAPSPRLNVSRVLSTAEQTADLLMAQSTAMDATCAVIEQAKSNSELDAALAAAEFRRIQQRSWPDVLAELAGFPHLMDELELAGIMRRLHDALAGRVATVNAALEQLQSALSADPTVAPDGLRGGPDPMLPPDPVQNPAHRADAHNRALLATDLSSGNPARIAFARSILQSLQHAAQLGGTAQLVVYDSAAFRGQGRAAISVGDLTTATSVAVVVPGITNSPSSMSGGIDLASNLRDQAERADPAHRTAVVAWYGYDIPLSFTKDPGSDIWTDVLDTLAAGSAANSASGAPLLAADLDAVKSMSQESVRLTVLGFSMGSTTVSEAARYRLPVDSIVLLGSPGAGWDTDNAAGYQNVPASQVYVLSYDQDPVTLPITDELATDLLRLPNPYGPDPASKSFGATDIDAATNVALLARSGLLHWFLDAVGDPRQHSMNNYMRGQALVAEGAIVVGRTDLVPTRPGR